LSIKAWAYAEIDLEDITRMQMRIFEELAPNLVRWYKKHPEAFREGIEGPAGQEPKMWSFYTIADDDEVVGSGGLVQAKPKTRPDIAELSSIYLLPQYRGKGLGRILTEDLIQKAEELGFSTIFLTTRREFDIARKLYESLGFKPIKNWKYPGSNNSFAYELYLW
jgi:ribosomal protein S18 acetylase RimI-like enzyme